MILVAQLLVKKVKKDATALSGDSAMSRYRLLAGGGAQPRQIPAPSPLLSISAVAGTLSVCERTVRRSIVRGDLPSHQVGRSVRVSEADLRAYLAGARQQKL